MNLTAVEQGHVNIQIEIKKGFQVLFIDFVELFSHVHSSVFLQPYSMDERSQKLTRIFTKLIFSL
jgi:hypothetical protein